MTEMLGGGYGTSTASKGGGYGVAAGAAPGYDDESASAVWFVVADPASRYTESLNL